MHLGFTRKRSDRPWRTDMSNTIDRQFDAVAMSDTELS